MNYMLMPLRRYADFQGRSRRKEFWLFNLAQAIVWVVIGGLFLLSFLPAMSSVCAQAANGDFDGLGGGGTLDCNGDTYEVPASVVAGVMGASMGIVGIVALLYWLIMVIPSMAVTIRRLHDQDKSGWFILLGLIPFVGGIILLVFYCLDGTRGPNRFGPDPKGYGHDNTFG